MTQEKKVSEGMCDCSCHKDGGHWCGGMCCAAYKQNTPGEFVGPSNPPAPQPSEKVEVQFYRCGECGQEAPIINGEYNLVHDGKCSKPSKEAQPYIEGLARKMHEWYLEASAQLHPESFNPKAQKPYEGLTEEQKFLDRYIAQRVAAELLKEREAGRAEGQMERINWRIFKHAGKQIFAAKQKEYYAKGSTDTIAEIEKIDFSPFTCDCNMCYAAQKMKDKILLTLKQNTK